MLASSRRQLHGASGVLMDRVSGVATSAAVVIASVAAAGASAGDAAGAESAAVVGGASVSTGGATVAEVASTVNVAVAGAAGDDSSIIVATTAAVGVGRLSGVVTSAVDGAPGVDASVGSAAGVTTETATRSNPTKPGAASTLPAPSRMPINKPTSAHSQDGAPRSNSGAGRGVTFAGATGWGGALLTTSGWVTSSSPVAACVFGAADEGAGGVARLAVADAGATVAADAAPGCVAPSGCPQWRQKRVSLLTSLPQLGQRLTPAAGT